MSTKNNSIKMAKKLTQEELHATKVWALYDVYMKLSDEQREETLQNSNGKQGYLKGLVIMALTEQETRFIERYRRLNPAAKYALVYVTFNADKITSQEEMYAIGNQKIAEYNAGVIDEKYVLLA